MKKPNSFSDLPAILQKSLLWDMELDFDGYESSKGECIHDINNGNVSSTNEYIIENAYKFMEESFLIGRAESLLSHEEEKLRILRDFIK